MRGPELRVGWDKISAVDRLCRHQELCANASANARLGATLDNWLRVTWTYDPANQLIGEHRSGSPAYRHTFAYDPAGNRETLHDGAVVTTYSHDPANCLQWSNDGLDRTTYTYDAVGNRTTVETPAGDVTSYSYDFENQLIRIELPDTTVVTYTYDACGNRLSVEAPSGDITSYTYDIQNHIRQTELSNGTITTYTYDANGNRQTVEEPTGDVTTYVWDYENRLTRVEHPDGEIVTSIYDPDHHRVAQEDDIAEQRFVYDGHNVLQARDDLGTVEAEYTYQPQEYARYVSQHRDAESRFYHTSGIHDVTQLSDAGETVTDDYRCDAWGKPLATTGSTENPHTYKGEMGYQSAPQLSNEESSYSLHHRVLPSLGQFLSEDRVDDDANLYRYVRNNPVNVVDPSGLQPALSPPPSSLGQEEEIRQTLRKLPPEDRAELVAAVEADKPKRNASTAAARSSEETKSRQEGTLTDGLIDEIYVKTGYLLSKPKDDYERAWLARADWAILDAIDNWGITAYGQALVGDSFGTLVLRREERLQAAREVRSGEFNANPDRHSASRAQSRRDADAAYVPIDIAMTVLPPALKLLRTVRTPYTIVQGGTAGLELAAAQNAARTSALGPRVSGLSKKAAPGVSGSLKNKMGGDLEEAARLARTDPVYGRSVAPNNPVQRRTLYHYTDEAGLNGIAESNSLRASTKASNPKDVRYGNGQYVSDFAPGTKTPAQLSREFLGQPFQGKRFTHYIEIDVTDLPVVQGRNGVFVIPNDVPLDLSGRIIRSGNVPQ